MDYVIQIPTTTHDGGLRRESNPEPWDQEQIDATASRCLPALHQKRRLCGEDLLGQRELNICEAWDGSSSATTSARPSASP